MFFEASLQPTTGGDLWLKLGRWQGLERPEGALRGFLHVANEQLRHRAFTYRNHWLH